MSKHSTAGQKAPSLTGHMGTVVLYRTEQEGGPTEEAAAAWRPCCDPLASARRDQGLGGSRLRVRSLRVTNQATL